ncbi:hypothetical protein BV25DRAFT_1820822 [Artomyces pyxidatus]|uniref:Uncharacterized protein n=1 Tax=Artomyces pyxidatus TaxID=48021 RepID=A0ACB8TE95_9AGAM|nr:hypothetical protein BV25DRAFT_1820822 [Artomyces pyxidatus]
MSLQRADDDAFWEPEKSKVSSVLEKIPPALERATLRLEFPPSYVVVGAYRLLTDKLLFVPIWKKCKHGFLRGLGVGAGWALFSFKIQRKLVKIFWLKSPTVTALATHDTVLGFKVPFDVPTYATVMLLSTQLTLILTFFLSRNLRLARERAWDQTVASRGKGPDFWQPYVEEWDTPPVVDDDKWAGLASAKGWVLSYTVKRVLLLPLHVVPLAGIFVAAGFKALETARHLHRPYFEAKKMTRPQVAVFIAEHKWDYRSACTCHCMFVFNSTSTQRSDLLRHCWSPFPSSASYSPCLIALGPQCGRTISRSASTSCGKRERRGPLETLFLDCDAKDIL